MQTRILAVDDDRIALDLLVSLADRLGFEDVSTASSAETALEILNGAAEVFQCLLLDISMLGMDGIELSALIRKLPADEPPRIFRRPFDLSYAAISDLSRVASKFASAFAGGMFPMGSSRRRLLNQSSHSSVAYSTASKRMILTRIIVPTFSLSPVKRSIPERWLSSGPVRNRKCENLEIYPCLGRMDVLGWPQVVAR